MCFSERFCLRLGSAMSINTDGDADSAMDLVPYSVKLVSGVDEPGRIEQSVTRTAHCLLCDGSESGLYLPLCIQIPQSWEQPHKIGKYGSQARSPSIPNPALAS